MCRLRNIAMRDYQESVTTPDRQTHTHGQSDPYVPLCFAGDTKVGSRFRKVSCLNMRHPNSWYRDLDSRLADWTPTSCKTSHLNIHKILNKNINLQQVNNLVFDIKLSYMKLLVLSQFFNLLATVSFIFYYVRRQNSL